MGTYTTNYNLFLPTIGEQGWGTLVNGNFTTIDITMAGLNTRLIAVENEVNGALNCTSVTTSGTITSTGKITGNGGIGTTSLTTSSTITSTGLITANGGIKGNLTGNVTGNASTATQLNKTVTVTPTSSSIGFTSMNLFTYCPYVPVVLYTGNLIVTHAKDYSVSTMYTLSSSDTWSSTSITGSTSAITKSFTNAKSVVVLLNGGSFSVNVRLPTFSV